MLNPTASLPEAVVAQAAATLAAGALRSSDPIDQHDPEKLGDYALDVFWHIYEAMRIGVETPPPILEEVSP
ncbi:MAG: hypothetical protein JWO85_3188 [Candidatus Eremiobacteraeota bacterium]|nr:hypothetical protein [Candidatus Eremiobacteraeota bacterium]